MLIRFVTATPLARLAMAIVVACLMSACSTTTERAGSFTLRKERETFLGHSSTTISLLHGRRVISQRVSDWSVDPRNPDRIVFSTLVDEGSGCGTYLFDARTNASWRLSPRAMIVHPGFEDSPVDAAGTDPWSPDGRYVFAGNDISRPLVVDLVERRIIELSDSLSKDGRRVEVRATVWSPDSRKLAVEVAANGYNGGRDLAAITISPLSVEYAASMDGSLPLWTTADYRWQGDALVASAAGKNGPIIRRSLAEVGWTPSAPRGQTVSDDARCMQMRAS